MVLVNSPHNPTGHVLSASELDVIGKLCVEFDCLAVWDEVCVLHVLCDCSVCCMCAFIALALNGVESPVFRHAFNSHEGFIVDITKDANAWNTWPQKCEHRHLPFSLL